MSTELVQGRVVRSVGDYHTVVLQTGEELICRTRGRLKLDRGAVITGDLVGVVIQGNQGIIEEVAPRKTELYRPPIANVDQAVVVTAVAQPDPVPQLIDRILALAVREGLSCIIVFNKIDLVDQDVVDQWIRLYQQTGFPVVGTSTKTVTGIDTIRSYLRGRVSVLAGPSGSGKSSLLNLVIPGVELKTAAVSERITRGRHTTRHVTLLRHPDQGWVADSPGFATLSFQDMDPRELPDCYPDYVAVAHECRFSGCLHAEEPGCAVKEAVESGRLDRGRYQRYRDILAEVQLAFERRY